MYLQLGPKTESLFWRYVSVGGIDECWTWMGTPMGKGYGQVTVRRRKVGAHRVAYAISKGLLHDKAIVRHKCDNRICVNPSHLLTGTTYQNIHDCIDRGRAGSWNPAGEINPNSILTDADVISIRNSTATRHELAIQYGVSHSAICRIVARKSWKHIPGPRDVGAS